MKVYPKQSPGCLAVSASAGAVDPKTHRKWVWAFIDAIANLVGVLVSKITCGNQCGSDILLKCCGSISDARRRRRRRRRSPLQFVGLPFQEIRICQSTQISFFFQHLVLTPPLPLPPQTQIVFKSRLGAHNVLNDCTITVDGTDFCIPQKGAATKGNAFASHKYAGKSALRYELGVDILVGNLVWIQRPYPAGNGKYTDIKIYNKGLRDFLQPGERVEADEGYPSHPEKIECPGNDVNPADNRTMQGRV